MHAYILFGGIVELIFSGSLEAELDAGVEPESLHAGNQLWSELDLVQTGGQGCDGFDISLREGEGEGMGEGEGDTA